MPRNAPPEAPRDSAVNHATVTSCDLATVMPALRPARYTFGYVDNRCRMDLHHPATP